MSLRYSYIAKGTFLSRKEDFHTKGTFHFKILNSLTIIVHVLSLNGERKYVIVFV